MSKVITFSRHFPKGHPRAGEPTYFLQKILHSLVAPSFTAVGDIAYPPKFHTIRAGNRFKVGERISLRVWKDKPYRSKQSEICEVPVIAIWQFVIDEDGYFIDGNQCGKTELHTLAKNDGLEFEDFKAWFDIHPKKKDDVFKGQIICWHELINY